LESYIVPNEVLKQMKPSPCEAIYRFVAVYMDDFILAMVESQDATRLRRMARATLLGIHSMFPPVEVTDHVKGERPYIAKEAG
jgi:hypothetical protein